jgi:signal peptidase II
MLSPAAFYMIALAAIVLDQAVKEWVRNALPVQGSIPLWPGVFHLTHTQNPGMAFSLLEGKTGILAAAAFAVVAVIIGTQWRLGSRMPVLLGWALSLPLGGAIGNLIDRLRHGYVTDLFDFRLIHFPVFNIADSAISIGVVLLAWHTLRTPEEPPVPKVAPVEGEG